MVVELNVAPKALSGFPGTGIVLQVDLFVLDGPPQALREYVVYRSTLPIHADLDAGILQSLDVLRACEMAPLVAVPDRWPSLYQGSLDSSKDKPHLQPLIQLPTHNVAGEPVQDGHQIHPSPSQPNVGDINAPDVIGVAAYDIAQQVGINPVFHIRATPLRCEFHPPLAQVRPWTDARNAHLPHTPLDRLTIDPYPLPLQLHRNAPGAVEGILGVNLVDAMLDSYLLGRSLYRLVVQTRAAQAKEVSLNLQ